MIKKLYIYVFLTILITPGIYMIIGIKIGESCENRALEQLPEFNISKKYFKDFEKYYNNNFVFKNTLNKIGGRFKYNLFRSSAKPDKTIIGKKGWLFYTDKNDQIMDSYTRNNLFTKKQLEYYVKEHHKRKLYLDSKQTKYYVAVWPNKSTVYSTFIPNRMSKIKQDTISRLDQLKSYLNKNDIDILDVRQLFSNKKKDVILYYKHDTHWNDMGAFFAYQALMKKIGITPYKLDDFEIKWKNINTGDLFNGMALCNENIYEPIPFFKFMQDSLQIEEKVIDIDNLYCRVNINLKNNKKILFFRDSYTTAMQQFLQLHFSETWFMWGAYNPEVVKKINPDIVVISKVERYL